MICPLMSGPIINPMCIEKVIVHLVDCQKENCPAWNKFVKDEVKCDYLRGYRFGNRNISY